MPGVLIVEAMAQAGAVAVLAEEENRGKIAVLRGHRRRAASSAIVEPGDVLELECEFETVRGPIGRGKARATVGGELAARGDADLRGGSDDRRRANGRRLDHGARLQRAGARR